MALSTKAIKGRIKSVKNTKKITKAMEMVAASKMRKAVERSLASRAYANRALELLVNISKERFVTHPLLEHPREKGSTLLLIIAANKGLCGGYNVNVYKEVKQYMDSHQERESIEAVCVGKYAEAYARKLGLNVVGSFINFPDTITPEDVRGLSRLIIDEYLKGKYYRVRMVYTHFISAVSNEILIRSVLPVKEENIRKSITATGGEQSAEPQINIESMTLYQFEPSEEAALAKVLPILTETQLYQGIVESVASEHSARMVAMKNASESADDMVKDLTLSFNKARQASITQEIMEIASGAEALG